MTCPRCNTEGDVSKSPCPRCGLFLPAARRSRARPTVPSERGNAPFPQTPRPRIAQNPQLGDTPVGRQQSSGIPPVRQQSGGVPPVRPQQNDGQQSNRMPSMRRQEHPTQSNNAHIPMTPYPSSIPPTIQPADLQREMLESSQPPLPAQDQWHQFGTPSSSAVNALPNTPRPANMSSPNYENNPFLARLRKDDASAPRTHGIEASENEAIRNVPQRPQAQPPLNRSTENLLPDMQRSIRPSRLVTDALSKEAQQRQPGSSSSFSSGLIPTLPQNATPFELPQLAPGTLLRGGRYRLRELQSRQDWLGGVFEATWIAQDAQRSGSQVTICELVTPDSKSMVMQSTLRNATMALTSVGRHPHIPTLWDAFSDQGRNFFVFEPTIGESLAARMRRTRRALAEQDVVECCLQMTEILELLAQQSPPLVHGLIRPEHIIIGRGGSEYTLTNFSIVLAGGATQYVAGIDRSTPYIAPEFVRGTIDGNSDLYSLLATAYHTVTGSPPVNVGITIPQARSLNPTVSSAFDAILTRGLRPIASQRYQRPSELRQDLLAIRAANNTSTTNSSSLAGAETPKAEQPVTLQTRQATHQTPQVDTLSQVLPSMLASSIVDDQEHQLLLPRPEELPPMPMRNDFQQAAFWLVGILIGLIIIVIVSRGFM